MEERYGRERNVSAHKPQLNDQDPGTVRVTGWSTGLGTHWSVAGDAPSGVVEFLRFREFTTRRERSVHHFSQLAAT